jgi:RNA polymerase sigma-70 factor (ECF subfamily)
MNDADFDIIRNIQKGQVNDYEWLVKKYQSAVYNVLYHFFHQEELALELSQETFVKAYEHLGNFNFKSRFFSWIYRIAINTAISYQKKQNRQKNTGQFMGYFEKPVDEKIMENEKTVLLEKAIDRLENKYKMVILLKYFEQLSYADMAQVLGISEKKVKSRLFVSRKLLKNILLEFDYFS